MPWALRRRSLCRAPERARAQASVREIKRLDSISRSPVYSSLGEALAGLPTIRAYRAEQRLASRNARLVDARVVMSLVNMSMNRRAAPPPRASDHAGLAS